jgi:hypothetical protein
MKRKDEKEELRQNPRRKRYSRLDKLLRVAGIPEELAIHATTYLYSEGHDIVPRQVQGGIGGAVVLMVARTQRKKILEALEEFNDYLGAVGAAEGGKRRRKTVARRNPGCPVEAEAVPAEPNGEEEEDLEDEFLDLYEDDDEQWAA